MTHVYDVRTRRMSQLLDTMCREFTSSEVSDSFHSVVSLIHLPVRRVNHFLYAEISEKKKKDFCKLFVLKTI